ncbi:MAG: trypsin-like peptidase domain-containing protein, partial [Candidatus Gracilibacteria bacterium]
MGNTGNPLKSILLGAVTGAVVAVVATYSTLGFAGVLNSAEGRGKKAVVSENSVSDVTGKITTNGGYKTQEDLVVGVVKDASPAVVSVIITKDVPILEKYYSESTNPFGDGFTFQIPQYRQNGTEKKEVGGGSGFIVSSDGYVVTNKHVVDDEKAEYTVIMNDEKKYDATVIAKDPLNDIAVLKIKSAPKNLPYLEFGDSDGLKAGQTAIAIGNPLMQFNNSVSVGVVSGLSRSINAGGGIAGGSEHLEGVIQTDAAINPGNSGGPLLNLSGDVIGVNVAIANGAEGIGFALPTNLVKTVVESVKENGKIVRPFLGIRYVSVTKELKDANKLTVDYGVLVARGETVTD